MLSWARGINQWPEIDRMKKRSTASYSNNAMSCFHDRNLWIHTRPDNYDGSNTTSWHAHSWTEAMCREDEHNHQRVVRFTAEQIELIFWRFTPSGRSILPYVRIESSYLTLIPARLQMNPPWSFLSPPGGVSGLVVIWQLMTPVLLWSYLWNPMSMLRPKRG